MENYEFEIDGGKKNIDGKSHCPHSVTVVFKDRWHALETIKQLSSQLQYFMTEPVKEVVLNFPGKLEKTDEN